MAIGPVARDSVTAEFFDGTRAGTFLLRRRRSSGEYLDPRTTPSISDEADVEHVPASGHGRVVSWATVHRDGARTVVGIVELDEGPWWWCQLADLDPDTDLTGRPVRVDFVASGPDPEQEVVPIFRAAQPDD